MSRKATPPTRSRNKPNFGLPWISILLGAVTVVFATTGLVVTTAQPEFEVRIIVEGQQPWNISQETVEAAEAAMGHPVTSWQPLTLKVTDRTLSLAEQQGNLTLGTDILLSTKLPKPAKIDVYDGSIRRAQARDKVAVRPFFDDPAQDLAVGQEIHDAYQENVGIGHGPVAVIAAAQEASQQLDHGSPPSPWPWISTTALGLALTAFALSKAQRRRSRWGARFRRLTAAQRQLAGVVLELEALEVTYLASDPEQRPRGFTAAWTTVRDASLDLARTEEKVAAAVHARGSGMTPKTAEKLEKFESRVSQLAASADAVMGAGAVIGRFGGGENTFQRLAAPLTFATRELLARLRAAPAGAIDPQAITELESALDALLEASTGKTGGSEHAVRTWNRAERALKRQAQTLSRTLRRRLPRRPEATPRPAEDLSVLRTSLGLTPQGSRLSLNAVDEVNAMAREAFGRLPEFDDAAEPERRKTPVNPTLRKVIRWGAKVLAGIALVLVSAFLSALVIVSIEEVSEAVPTGNRQLQALRFEPDDSKFDVEEIRRGIPGNFTEDLEVTVVARDAEDDLRLTRDPELIYKTRDPADPFAHIHFDAKLLVEAMWKIKAQYPHLVDEGTGELIPGQVVVPVWFFDDGSTTSPTWLTSAIAAGETSAVGILDWNTNRFYFDGIPEVTVGSSLDRLARVLPLNDYRGSDSTLDALFWLLFPTFGLVLFIGYQVLRYGGSMSMRLGRFGKGAARLRTVRKDLEALTMGLDDSRLNAVFMFDRGSVPLAAAGDQRLFESALAVAWRMAEELASRPLAQRFGPDYTARIHRLEYLVSVLSMRDADIAGRAQALLDATREA
jgi:hypothetical protein